jgi:hypothetical protein
MSNNPFSDSGFKSPPPPNAYDPAAFQMPPKKPGALTAIGVMGVVLGILGLMTACIAVVALPFQSKLQTAFNQSSPNDPPAVKIQQEMNAAMAAVQDKYFLPNMTFSVLHLVLATCMLIGGILVLRGRPAGRSLMIYVLLAAIAFEVLRTAFAVMVQLEVMPITSEFMEKMMKEAGPNGPGRAIARMVSGLSIFGIIMGLIWPLGKIIVYGLSARYLASKPIVEHFAGTAPTPAVKPI